MFMEREIMWSIVEGTENTTNKVVMPTDGIISVTKPDSVHVFPYVNDVTAAVHHVHVKAGDVVYFKLKGTSSEPTPIYLEFGGDQSTIMVPAASGAISTELESSKENSMLVENPVNLFTAPAGGAGMGGAIGGGLGAGLLGGVLGGALLGGNGGGLFGNRNNTTDPIVQINQAVASSEALTNARFDALAQADIIKTIAEGNAALGVSLTKQAGELGVQAALTASATQVQIAKVTGDLGVQLALGDARTQSAIEATGTASALAFKDLATANAQNAFDLANAVSADGQATRALIVAQNDAELNRRLVVAQAEIIELRGDRRMHEMGAGITISNNNNAVANAQQQQAQQQQQLQYSILNQLSALTADLQTVKQSSVVFNSGTQVASGNQSAANTRVA